jgi:hypothetical protein
MRLKRNQVRLIAKSDQGREELAEYGDVWRIVEGPRPRKPGSPLAWRLHPLGGYHATHRKWVLVENDPHFEVYQGDAEFKPIRRKREFAMNVTREGREPAADLKKRLVAICEEAGLDVTGHISLWGERRIIWAEARSPQWPHETFVQIRLLASMGTNGDWNGSVDVSAPAPRPDDDFGSRMVILQRPPVPLTDLPAVLHETLEQQRFVMAARLNKERGPWVFGEAEWTKRRMT